jgi:hypothetical protein
MLEISIMVLQRQRPGLLDQELVDGDILATFLAHTALFDASKRRLGRRLVSSVLCEWSVIQDANCAKWSWRRDSSTYQTDHPGLQLLKHAPQTVNILGKDIAR